MIELGALNNLRIKDSFLQLISLSKACNSVPVQWFGLIWFSDKNTIHISYSEKFIEWLIARICCNEELYRLRRRTPSHSQSLMVTVESRNLATSFDIRRYGTQIRLNLLLWLASVTIVAACHTESLANSYFSKIVPQHASCQILVFHKVV